MSQRRFVPRKIVGELVGAWVDENGETTGEAAVGSIVLFPPDFAKVEQLVADAWPAAVAAQTPADTIRPPAGSTRQRNGRPGASSRARARRPQRDER